MNGICFVSTTFVKLKMRFPPLSAIVKCMRKHSNATENMSKSVKTRFISIAMPTNVFIRHFYGLIMAWRLFYSYRSMDFDCTCIDRGYFVCCLFVDWTSGIVKAFWYTEFSCWTQVNGICFVATTFVKLQRRFPSWSAIVKCMENWRFITQKVTGIVR